MHLDIYLIFIDICILNRCGEFVLKQLFRHKMGHVACPSCSMQYVSQQKVIFHLDHVPVQRFLNAIALGDFENAARVIA